MKLPVIKHANQFIEENSIETVEKAVEVLEHMSEHRSIKDNELDLIGELISNLYGAIEVNKMITEGKSEKDALNSFMQRVLGSIDQ